MRDGWSQHDGRSGGKRRILGRHLKRQEKGNGAGMSVMRDVGPSAYDGHSFQTWKRDAQSDPDVRSDPE